MLDAGYGWRFVVDGKDHMVPIRPRLVVNSAEAAVDAASTGFGLASVLTYQAEAALRRSDLCLIFREYEAPPLPVHFLYLGQGRLPLKVRAWLDFAGLRLRERIAAVDEALNRR